MIFSISTEMRKLARAFAAGIHKVYSLQLLKNMLSNIVKRYMRDPVKTYFGRLKIQVKF